LNQLLSPDVRAAQNSRRQPEKHFRHEKIEPGILAAQLPIGKNVRWVLSGETIPYRHQI
jgi:hypothetical protein